MRRATDSPTVSTDSSSSPGTFLNSARVRSLLVLAVLVAMVLSGTLSTPVLAVAGLMGVMALAVVAAPAIRSHWTFNVLVGVAVVLYGLAYGLGQRGLAGRAVAAGIVVLGLFVSATHLGVGPWSDRSRRT